MSLIKKISLITLSLIATLSIFTFVSAQTADVVGNLDSADCSTHYSFQSVDINIGPASPSYKAGETVIFSNGSILNKNPYPIVDGYLMARVTRANSNANINGNDIVDEFEVVGPVTIKADSDIPLQFKWQAPKNLKAGQYQIDFFFNQGKRFNLSGLYFSNEIVAATSKFEIKVGSDSAVYFDKEGTKVEGVKYQQIGDWPDVTSKNPVIEQKLINTGKKDITAEVTYELYNWDAINSVNKVYSNKENVILTASSTKVIKFIAPENNKPVYLLRMTTSVDGVKSIIYVRYINPDVTGLRLNSAGLQSFPIKKGENITAFVCAHNMNYSSTTGSIKVEVFNGDTDSLLGAYEYKGDISSDINGWEKNIVATEDLYKVKTVTSLFDKDGKSVDKYEMTYDCDLLGCALPKNNTSNINITIISALIFIVILFVLILLAVRSGRNKLGYIGSLVFTVILVMGIIMYISNTANKKPQPAAVINVAHASGLTNPQNYSVGTLGYQVSRGASQSTTIRSVSNSRDVAYAQISYTTYLSIVNGPFYQLDGNASYNHIAPGDNFNLEGSNVCTFSASGAAWDTPNCGSAAGIRNEGSRTGSVTYYNANRSYSVTSSNTGVISCSGLNCVANNPGTSNITLCGSGVNINGSTSYNTKDGNRTGITPSVSFGQVCQTWPVVVINPTPTPGVCGTVHNNCLAGTPVRPNEESGPVNYRYTWYCSGSFGGPESEMCIEPKPVTNGQCAPTHYGCVTGTSTNPSGELTGPPFWGWRWTCQGQNGGANPSCEEVIPPINGVCGTTRNNCVTGDPQNESETSTGYKWDCIGSYGGSSEYNCSRVYPGILNCRVFMTNPPSSPVNINTLTSWIATSSTEVLTDRQTVWTISDSNSIHTSTTTTNTIANNYTTFTTTGLKTVSAMIASTTASGTHIYLNCLANTAVFRRVPPGGPEIPVRPRPGGPPVIYDPILPDDPIYITGPNAFGTTTLVQTGGNVREQ